MPAPLPPYAEAMTITSQRATQAQLQALRAYFDDDGIVALTAWIAFQNMSAKFNAALGAEDNGQISLKRASRAVRDELDSAHRSRSP
jgi:hypothetical protein